MIQQGRWFQTERRFFYGKCFQVPVSVYIKFSDHVKLEWWFLSSIDHIAKGTSCAWNMPHGILFVFWFWWLKPPWDFELRRCPTLIKGDILFQVLVLWQKNFIAWVYIPLKLNHALLSYLWFLTIIKLNWYENWHDYIL